MSLPPQPTAQQFLEEGRRQHQAGNLQGAQHCYQQALIRQPDHLDALHMLGVVAIAMNQPEMAVDLFGRALMRIPNEMLIRMKLAQALQKAGRVDEALKLADTIVAQPEPAKQAMGHYVRACMLHALNRSAEAAEDAERAEQLNPGGLDELLLLPTIYLALGRFDDALAASHRGVAAHPQRGEPYWNLALTALLKGDMQTGWPAFQWRMKTDALRHLAAPAGKTLWEGQDLTGKTILLYREGGFGDALQFVRYVPMVMQRAAKVILSAPPELVELFKCVPVSQLIPQVGTLPPCDLICPLQSLPMNFGTTLETIPAEVPYLRADPQKSRAWSSRVSGDGLKVGLAWSGSMGNIERRTRSLQSFAPLADVKGVKFFSLQKSPESWQTMIAPPGLEIVDLMPEARDFADLAAIIDNLDLVISVDTSVPHLAGAMGKLVWVLIPSIPDFRWMLEREDSPWYPTMRLFRQKTGQSWDEPIARIVAALQELARSSGRPE